MNKKKILVIDDDKKLTDIIQKYFSQYEFNVIVVNDGKFAETVIQEEKPDIILLDVMLPTKSGFEILKDLQKDKQIPIIMLTAKGDEIDKVIGLELGADDYVTKPFSIRELGARIRNVLRRSNTNIFDKNSSAIRRELIYGNLSINPDKRVLVIDGKEMELTKTEFEIIYLLASNTDKTFSREELLKVISDRAYESFDRSIDMHISHLRSKLKQQETQTCFIKTVWGAGYRFECIS